MNEELDSQLSAMFDDELPSGECELLARRLSRDEQLKARWGRYAIVGAVIRAERGVRLNAPLASRVSAQLLSEPELAAAAVAAAPQPRSMRWWQPVAATALAASVAAVSVLWLRAEAPGSAAPRSARLDPIAQSAVIAASVRATSPASYVVPPLNKTTPALVPSTELANYVVAHSMFSSPVGRRNLLSAFMTNDPVPGASQAPEGNVQITAH
jgi:sigma-E factor negative regulatory protein RseA